MKEQIDRLDATPTKRIYYSIIADYDLNRSVCELIDNGLDVWVRNGRQTGVGINITLDKRQQTIKVIDNAGGVPRHELSYIVGPGQTGTDPSDETIGIFGVGTKRAVVALAQDITIKTRHLKGKTYQVEFEDDWIKDENWELPYYQVDPIAEGSTIIELKKLRAEISDESIKQLGDYLSATYAKFLRDNKITIRLNEGLLSPQFFEDWAFPPGNPPQKYRGTLNVGEARTVRVEATAGLTTESSPAAGEYGVYLYCNDRLVARALKTFDVGFTKGLAGLPHPKISLARGIVSLKGDAQSMPWNSSKSDVNTKHEVFLALRDWLVDIVTHNTSLSRILEGDWPNRVFKYTSGDFQEIEINDFHDLRKSYLPPLPKSRPRYGEVMVELNKKVVKAKPWTRGLYEGVVAADLISKQRLGQKNRIALIVLDSTLEIAFKEYLVNESGSTYNDKKLTEVFAKRSNVHDEIKKFVHGVSDEKWAKINYYYNLRCKLIHEKISATINDEISRTSGKW